MSKIHRILCPVDFSDPSRAAFDYAENLARLLGAELLVLHAFDRPRSYDAAGQTVPADESIVEKLNSISPQHADVPVTRLLHAGMAEDVICWAAESQSCDLIVMGTHGHTGLKHLLFGSTAEYVLRHARCPVLTIRPQPVAQDPLPEPVVSPMPPPRYL